jgi:hypothetical protein
VIIGVFAVAGAGNTARSASSLHVDNAVLQQRRIKTLFPIALSIQLFSKRCDQK